LLAAVITFGCASSAVIFPAGELPWYDFIIVTALIALVLDSLFLICYFFEHRKDLFLFFLLLLSSCRILVSEHFSVLFLTAGWEWCYEPLRGKMPLAELILTLIWSIIWVVCAIVFASNYSSLFDIIPGTVHFSVPFDTLNFRILISPLFL